MAVSLFYDAQILYAQYDLSGDHNEIRLDRKTDMKEITRFGADTHSYIAGLRAYEVAGRGYVNFDDSTTPKGVDNELFNEVGGLSSAGKALTLCPSTAAGAVAFIGTADLDSYSFNLKNDSVGTFDVSMKSAGVLVRGQNIYQMQTSGATSGFGPVYQLGALSATQKMYANFHLVAISGTTPSLTVELWSNPANTTVGGTLRGTFGAQTVVTSGQITVNGAVTDPYWYVKITGSGTSLSYRFACAAGIR